MQWDRHKAAKSKLKEIFNHYDRYRIIHYSCESFDRSENGKTCIITAIAIYSFISDSTQSFDIQTTAERLGINYEDIAKDKNLEIIEQKLLNDFFEFIKYEQNSIYLHWNMRNSLYGFQALSNRYAVLNKKNPEYEIPDERRINISKILDDYYGINYVKHPKIKNIVELNPIIKPKFILYGDKEAKAFEEGKYNELHKSTLSKVRLFSGILRLVEDNKLKVSNSRIKAFGYSPQVIYEITKEKWWWALITFIFGIIMGRIIK